MGASGSVESITSLDRHPNTFHPKCHTFSTNSPDRLGRDGKTDTLGLFGLSFDALVALDQREFRPLCEDFFQTGSGVEPHLEPFFQIFEQP